MRTKLAFMATRQRMLLVWLGAIWIFCLQRPSCSAAVASVANWVTATSEKELLSAFANPNITVIIMLQDIAMSANCTVPGVPPGEIYVLTRNLTVTVADNDHSATDWYPTLDITSVLSPKILIPLGIMLTYDHIMFANIGPFHSYTVGTTGFTMPYIHRNSTGTLHLVNGVLFVPFCSQTDAAMRMWRGLPRPAALPGVQQAEPMPDGWCAIPDPGVAFAGQCWASAYRMVDVGWRLDKFSPNSSIAPMAMNLLYVNLVLLCNQLTSAAPTQPGQHASPSPPPMWPPLPPRVLSASSSPSVGTGVVVGVVVGAAAAVLLAVAVGLLIWRRRRLQAPASAQFSSSSSSRDPAERFDDDVRKERNRFNSMLEQLTTQDRRLTMTDDTSSGSPRGGNGSANSDNTITVGKVEPEASCDSTAMTSSAPDPVDELHEMSRSMQTSIRDKQLHIQAVIGSGAFGTVYRGSWQGLPVAIKTLMFSSHTLGGAGGQSHSVLTEAALSKSISHPNVVATYNCDLQRVPADRSFAHTLSINDTGAVVNDWRLYIIQEYCDGGSLYAALRTSRPVGAASGARGPPIRGAKAGTAAAASITFDMETVFELAFDIACGMSHLHERNVIHGDLNPANVLLKRKDSGRWIPKVCDFGFSVHLTANQSHVSNTRRGTPFYVAPEVMQCGKMSRAADVYAMGVMLWELYMGQTVWKESLSGAPELQSTFPRLPSSAPRSYAQLIIDCIRFDALQRPTFLGVMECLLALKHARVPQEPAAVVVSMGPPGASAPSPAATAATAAATSMAARGSTATADNASSVGSYSYDYCYGSTCPSVSPPSAAATALEGCPATASGASTAGGSGCGGCSGGGSSGRGDLRGEAALPDMYCGMTHTGMSFLFENACDADAATVPAAPAT